MEIRQITEDYSVAPQIGVEHLPQIKAAGFRSVVCNRPDAEDGAVPHDEIAAAAREAGLEFRYIPVVSGQMTQQNVEDQAAVANLYRLIGRECRGRCSPFAVRAPAAQISTGSCSSCAADPSAGLAQYSQRSMKSEIDGKMTRTIVRRTSLMTKGATPR